VDVDVDEFRINGEEQGQNRVAVVRQHVAIGAAHRPQQQAVAYRATVDEQELFLRGADVVGGQTGIAGQAQALAVDIHRHRVGGEVAAQQGAQAGEAGVEQIAAFGRQGQAFPPVVGEGKPHLRVRHRQTLHRVQGVGGLGARAFQEFQTRRSGEEQVADFDAGAGRMGGGFGRGFAPPSTAMRQAASAPGGRETMDSLATAPMLGRASPRKPKWSMWVRSPVGSFEVA
jgi:hypothetical protein